MADNKKRESLEKKIILRLKPNTSHVGFSSESREQGKIQLEGPNTLDGPNLDTRQGVMFDRDARLG